MDEPAALPPQVAAVVLAAGQSRRMGSPKMILPWGTTTVIGQVVGVLAGCDLAQIVVVTGGARQQVEAALQGLPARTVFNPDHAGGEMLSSLKVGLQALPPNVDAALVVLGDQPQIQAQVVTAVIAAHRQTGDPLVVPSYQMRRGHPWLVQRPLWGEILRLEGGKTLRHFLNDHAGLIHYLPVTTPSVLHDLDTPEDYTRQRPARSSQG